MLMSFGVHAQVVVREFYDNNDCLIDELHSTYYRAGRKALVVMKYGTDTREDTAFVDSVKTFFTASDRIRSREFYRDGYREGPFSEYHENGRLKNKGTYRESHRVGYLTSWYENGGLHKVLNYVPIDRIPGTHAKDSFQIIHYWNTSSDQLIKDGNGYCACTFESDVLLEKGKVVNGFRDSTWQYFSEDTLKFIEEFTAGRFLTGKAFHKGKEIIYHQREVQAQYPGGIGAMYKFLQRTVRYPGYAKRKGLQGRIFVKFIVDKDGTLSDITILKGVTESLDEEAMRVIRAMPRWIPGSLRGLRVKSQFVLPVAFKLG